MPRASALSYKGYIDKTQQNSLDRRMLSGVFKVFSEVLGVPIESISDETSPENTSQWDSLQAMNLVMALEATFDVRFSTKEILSMRTVGLVRKVLRNKGISDA